MTTKSSKYKQNTWNKTPFSLNKKAVVHMILENSGFVKLIHNLVVPSVLVFSFKPLCIKVTLWGSFPSQSHGLVHFRVFGQYQNCPFPMKTFKKTSTSQTSDMWGYLHFCILAAESTNEWFAGVKHDDFTVSIKKKFSIEKATVFWRLLKSYWVHAPLGSTWFSFLPSLFSCSWQSPFPSRTLWWHCSLLHLAGK